MQQDTDCLRSWLADVELAIQIQTEEQVKAAQVAKSFFVPWKKHTAVLSNANKSGAKPPGKADSSQTMANNKDYALVRSLDDSTQDYDWVDDPATTATFDF